MFRVLAISGSLRRASINTGLLRAAQRLAPDELVVSIYGGLSELPLFNPELDALPPAPVLELKRQLVESDVVLIASPEYAHGVTGAMKNCLDWLVSGSEFVHKPVALLNAAPRAHHAVESLKETLRTMSWALIESPAFVIPLGGRSADVDAFVSDPVVSKQLRAALDELAAGLRALPSRD